MDSICVKTEHTARFPVMSRSTDFNRLLFFPWSVFSIGMCTSLLFNWIACFNCWHFLQSPCRCVSEWHLLQESVQAVLLRRTRAKVLSCWRSLHPFHLKSLWTRQSSTLRCLRSLNTEPSILWSTDWLHWNSYFCQVSWWSAPYRFPAFWYQTEFAFGVRVVLQ